MFVSNEIKENERMEWVVGGACGTHGRGEKRVAYKFLVGKSERKRPL
jgi:hypothetical protein